MYGNDSSIRRPTAYSGNCGPGTFVVPVLMLRWGRRPAVRAPNISSSGGAKPLSEVSTSPSTMQWWTLESSAHRPSRSPSTAVARHQREFGGDVRVEPGLRRWRALEERDAPDVHGAAVGLDVQERRVLGAHPVHRGPVPGLSRSFGSGHRRATRRCPARPARTSRAGSLPTRSRGAGAAP